MAIQNWVGLCIAIYSKAHCPKVTAGEHTNGKAISGWSTSILAVGIIPALHVHLTIGEGLKVDRVEKLLRQRRVGKWVPTAE